MRYVKYGIVLLVLLLLHLFLSSWWLIVMWCLIGVALPFVWKERRMVLPVILLLECIAAVTLLLLFRKTDGQFDQLANHAGLSSGLLMMGIVLINVITAFLCISASSLLTRRIISMRMRNH